MHFFSIRWKIVAMAGVVMAAMAGLFTWQQHYALNQQFAREQADGLKHLRDISARLFAVQNDHMQMQARLLADMPRVRAAMHGHDARTLQDTVREVWPELNLGQGVMALVFLGPKQETLGQWGEPDMPRLMRLARLAGQRQTPQFWVSCLSRCEHQAVLPVVDQGRMLGSVALVSGLENLVLDLQRLSNSEVALLTGTRQAEGNPLSGLRLLSLSGGHGTQATLEHAWRGHWQGATHLVRQAGDAHVLQVMVVTPEVHGDGLLHFAVVSDVTRQAEAIDIAVWRNLAWGGGVLLASLLALYFMLRPAMRRISQISHLLPLLGQEKFEQVLGALPETQPATFTDEIYALEHLARELAKQLLDFHEAANMHSRMLAAQATQLAQERDFVTGLLDTAPVLIVTFGQDARVRMANRHAQSASGLNSAQLVGRPFADVFMQHGERDAHLAVLSRMRPGDVVQRDECFVGGNARLHDVLWFHSCLDDTDGERLFLSVGLDVTEHRRMERRLQQVMEFDVVTGLLNRTTFKWKLEELLVGQGKGLMLVCDIDEFRVLNDLDGHETGDQILLTFARYLQGLAPAPSLAARLGSDEFALVFPEITTADAILLAKQLNRTVSLPLLGFDQDVKRNISTSVGLVAFPEHGHSVDILLGNAELALAMARAKGHASWELYSEQEAYREKADYRAHWREMVEMALDENRFVLHFQPLLHIATGEIEHYESLLRMIGKDGKLIPPGMFIDVAESTGLIRRIDRWVIDAAVAAAALHPEIKLAFNLSSRSFDDDMAFETMQAALTRHGVPGERLLLEITETAALANLSGAKRIMARFQGLGCVFGLDDFGVGYSSFQYLKELPVGFVKIDGSFIKNLTKHADDIVFVRALNSAVQGFGKTTVAEFVEDQETLDILREIGVDFAQGYLIGKPAPLEPLEADGIPPI